MGWPTTLRFPMIPTVRPRANANDALSATRAAGAWRKVRFHELRTWDGGKVNAPHKGRRNSNARYRRKRYSGRNEIPDATGQPLGPSRFRNQLRKALEVLRGVTGAARDSRHF